MEQQPKQLPMYLDYNATTPILEEVGDAMLPFLRQHFGNPSSSHAYGRATKKGMDQARQQVAALLGAAAEEIVFTSGASESLNFALKGAALTQRELEHGNHIITSAIEHVCVLEVCKYLESQGFEVTYLPVDACGRVSLDALTEAVTDKTILVSIMTANNEVGTIQDIGALMRAAKAKNPNVLCHTDGSQGVGKIPVNVDAFGVDLLTVAGHKLYAPKGIGALYIRAGTPPLKRLIHGAGHEMGKRAGTENTLLAVGLGKACEIALRDADKRKSHMEEMRQRLLSGIKARLAHYLERGSDADLTDVLRVNGHPEHRLPNTLSISLKGVAASVLLSNIMDRVACSAGAACHSDTVKLSHVLQALDVSREWGMGTLRLSVGEYVTDDICDKCVDIIAREAANMMR